MKTWMKNLMMLSFLMTAFIQADAQEKEDWGTDSLECRKCLSLYAEPMKQKNYAEAATHWRCVINICPKYKESIYINGAIIYRSFIGEEKDAAKKEKYVDTLVWIYEKQMEYFGRNSSTLERAGNDMLMYRQNKPEQANKYLAELVSREKENTSCIALLRYYQSLYIMYAKKMEGVDAGKMMDEYFKVKEYIAAQTAKGSDKNCATADTEVDKLAAPFLPCDKVVEYYNSKYPTLPEDKAARAEILNKWLAVMNAKSCNDNDLYDKVAAEVYESSPSAEAAYNLGVALINKKKYSEANKYFKDAIEQCNGCDKMTDYLIGAAKANLGAGSYSTAASYAKQAAAKDPKAAGQAYIIVAKAIAGTKCGENSFEHRMAYMLAVEYLQRAKAADSEVASEANSLIGSYRSQFPSKTELFERGMLDKDTYTVGCWINESCKIVKE